MSDYTNTFGGAAKDAADAAIQGSDHDTQLNSIVTHIGTKADKAVSATAGNLAELTADGDPVDSGIPSAYLDGLTGPLQTQLDNLYTDNQSDLSEYTRVGRWFLRDGTVGSNVFINLASSLTAATWTSIGPTGAGATVTWGGLTALPSTARILLCQMSLELTTTATSRAESHVYFTHGNDATPALNADTLAASYGWEPHTTNSLTDGNAHMIMIPLHTDQTFKAYYSETSAGIASAIDLTIRGFICD